jgi:hypothetical protein
MTPRHRSRVPITASAGETKETRPDRVAAGTKPRLSLNRSLYARLLLSQHLTTGGILPAAVAWPRCPGMILPSPKNRTSASSREGAFPQELDNRRNLLPRGLRPGIDACSSLLRSVRAGDSPASCRRHPHRHDHSARAAVPSDSGLQRVIVSVAAALVGSTRGFLPFRRGRESSADAVARFDAWSTTSAGIGCDTLVKATQLTSASIFKLTVMRCMTVGSAQQPNAVCSSRPTSETKILNCRTPCRQATPVKTGCGGGAS